MAANGAAPPANDMMLELLAQCGLTLHPGEELTEHHLLLLQQAAAGKWGVHVSGSKEFVASDAGCMVVLEGQKLCVYNSCSKLWLVRGFRTVQSD